MNRMDLQQYKNKDMNTVNAMIPGINNFDGVGSNKALPRGGVQKMLFADDAGKRADKHKGQLFFSPQRQGPVHDKQF